MKFFLTVSDAGYEYSLVIASTSTVILIVIIQQNYTGEQNLQARCRKQHCPHTAHRARNCDQLSLDIPGCDGIAQWVQRLEY